MEGSSRDVARLGVSNVAVGFPPSVETLRKATDLRMTPIHPLALSGSNSY
jgi:hypothetical protein